MSKSKIERWASFDAWSEDGFSVRRGEKSQLRSPNGTPLFSEDQVEDFDWLDEHCVFEDIPH